MKFFPGDIVRLAPGRMWCTLWRNSPVDDDSSHHLDEPATVGEAVPGNLMLVVRVLDDAGAEEIMVLWRLKLGWIAPRNVVKA